MQKCIDAATPPQRDRLITAIVNLTHVFVRNAYGNYVVRFNSLNPQVQYVLEQRVMSVNKRVGESLLGHLLQLGN
jgi:hypothetical protein